MICSQGYPLLNISLPPHSSTKSILSSRDWGPPSENCCDYILVAHKILHIYNQETGICTLVHISLTESISSFLFPFFSILFSHKDKRGAIQCGWGYFVCVRPFVDPGRRSSSSRPYQGLTHIYISLVQDFLLLRVCCVERKKRNPAQREREKECTVG